MKNLKSGVVFQPHLSIKLNIFNDKIVIFQIHLLQFPFIFLNKQLLQIGMLVNIIKNLNGAGKQHLF
jgi:hypothetical protein